MLKKRNETLRTVSDVVCNNTGMTDEQLLDDQHEYKIAGLDEAAQMIRDGIREKKIFYIMGDFDVDGIMASAEMVMTLGKLHAIKRVRLPKRFTEGYGLQEDTVKDCEDGQILITVDNGISSIDAIALAKKKNMTVIVIDHHLPVTDPENDQPIYPDADLIIDPNAIPGSADFNGYCGAGLAFRLCQTLLGDDPLLLKLQSFAAIATIADSVPLIYENRRIVKKGLKSMVTHSGSTIGLYALLAELGLDNQIDEVKVGFKLAPTLNAPGRMIDNGAMQSLMLMIYEGVYGKAQQMAKYLVHVNEDRRNESEKWSQLTKAAIQDAGMEQDYPLVVHMPGIPEGVIGIIAGRMAEAFESPCILLGDGTQEGQLKGSCRSDGHVDLKNLLDHTAEYLDSYGGHAPAAGLKLHKDSLTPFREAAKKYLEGKRPPKDEYEYYDLALKEDEVKNVAFEVEKYAPYGIGNPVPTFILEHMTLKPCGSDYYKYMVGEEGVKLFGDDFEAASFHGAKEYRDLGFPRHVSLYGKTTINRYMGSSKAQFIYSKIKPVKTESYSSNLLNALSKSAAERN